MKVKKGELIFSKGDIMKKLISFVAALFVAATVFAQAGNKKLLAGVYDFATEPSKTWTIYDANFVSADPIAEKYVFDASFVVKIAIGLSRYDFTCTVAKQGDDFTVELSDMVSYACDKNLNIVKKGSVYNTAPRVSGEYAKQIKAEIEERMASWSDDEYNEKLTKAVTSPVILSNVAKNSALAFKKFVGDNGVEGKPISIKIDVTKVDEAPSYAAGYSYYVAGLICVGYEKGKMGIRLPIYESVMVYTNNDAVVSLVPADEFDIIKNGKTKGSVYEVKGTVRKVERKDIARLAPLQINE